MLSSKLIRAVLKGETDFGRFERFCNDLLAAKTGLTILPTSSSSDEGKDGVGLSVDASTPSCETASSVRTDFNAKVIEDATRLAITKRSSRIFLCSSQYVSQAVRQKAIDSAVAILADPRISVEVLTGDQIESLATEFSDVFVRHYGPEIEEYRSALETLDEDGDSLLHLQIAHAVGTDTDIHVREMAADALVLRELSLAKQPLTVNGISARLQARLQMNGGLPAIVIQDSLGRLAAAGHSEADKSGHHSILPLGRAAAEELDHRGNAGLVERRTVLRAQLEKRLGHSLSETQFDGLWKRLVLSLCAALTRYGHKFLAIASQVAENGDLGALRESGTPLIRHACREAASTLSTERGREEAEEALLQILLDSRGDSASWLEHLAGAWLTICSLGLSDAVSAYSRRALRDIILVLDTDILLSLMCEAERASGPLAAMLGHWHAIGGRTYVSQGVLAELAHHAWIARAEHADISSVVSKHKYEPGLSRAIARNAFVRSYWYSHKVRTPAAFERFIRVYSGATVKDTSQIAAVLKRFRIGVAEPEPLESEVQRHSAVATRAKRVLARTMRFSPFDASAGFIAQDKMERDSHLIAECAAIATREAPHGIVGILLLTSSKRLQIAVRRSCDGGAVFGAPASALASLLAVVPNVSVTPAVVSALLFDEEAGRPISALRSHALRLLERSEISALLPPARIVTLERQLSQSIREKARSSARTRESVEDDVLHGRDPDLAIEVVAKSLRAVAIGTEADAMIRELTSKGARGTD